jgi:sialate O-acetylesterase
MFGRRLFDRLGGSVPVGLAEVALGGTAVELWSPPSALERCDQQRGPQELNPACAKAPPSPMEKEVTYTNSTLWNAMLAPWTPMAARGAVWYQASLASALFARCFVASTLRLLAARASSPAPWLL